MAAKYIRRIVALDGNPPAEQLPGALYKGESGAHVFVIICRRGAQALALNGSVSAEFVNGSEATISLTGSVVDGAAVLPLGPDCYGEAGPFRLTIFHADGNEKSAIYRAEGRVDLSGTDTAYVPSGTIASLAELQRLIEEARNSIPADYSALANAVNKVVVRKNEVLVDGYSNLNTIDTVVANSPFVFSSFLGKTPIGRIKIYGKKEGTVSLGVISRPSVVSGQQADRTLAHVKEVINITLGEQEIVLQSPFAITDGEYLFIGMPYDTGKWAYGNYGAETGFLYVSPDTGAWAGTNSSCGVSFYSYGYEFSEDVQEIANKAEDANNSVEFISDFLELNGGTEQLIYKSVAGDAQDASIISVAPFIISELDYSDAPFHISAIKINISQIGYLSFGRVLKTKAAVGESWNPLDFADYQTVQITETGPQIINITPIEISDDYYFFVGVRGDTAVFLYGGAGSGTTSGFIYVQSGAFVRGYSRIGVDLYSKPIPQNVRDAVKSKYAGKKLSILGDSISTFDGYIPEGNATYYPGGTVTKVSDTWWHKLLTALGMALDTNNSWSGSRVTTTGGDASAGCMARSQNLGTPDVIIVWMGINDFNNEVPLGTYDGTTALPMATNTFREAYAIMLNKILAAYQRAEVWVCTLPQCERNAEAGFPEINGDGAALASFNKAIRELADAFGAKVLEHNKCGLTYQNMPVYNPDNLHPNKFGHSLIANNDIWQMDSTVSKRYSIS